MDYRQGVTITPMIAYDERGQEIIDYDHAVVEDHAIRRQQYDQVQAEQEQYVREYSDGSLEHVYDLGEEGAQFDEGQHYLSEYQDDEDDEYEEEEEFEDDEFAQAVLDTIYEHLCDEDTYDQMMVWAEDNIPEEEIEDFNNVMDSQDGEMILRYIYALYELYMEGDDPNEY